MLRDPMKFEQDMPEAKRSRMMMNGPVGMMGGMMAPMGNQSSGPMQSTPVRPTKVRNV
jgi:hypothetical protein